MNQDTAHLHEPFIVMPQSSPVIQQLVQQQDDLPVAVVAGSAGFVGSYLCSALIAHNCKVVALDNFVSGKKENVEDLLKEKNFEFIETDLKEPLSLSYPKIDYVIHLAGCHFYPDNANAQKELLLVNSSGTKNLLDLAKKHQAKFLLGSTPDIYQGFISSTQLENYYGVHTDQEYGKLQEAKRFSEGLVQQYYKEQSLDCRIVRFFDTYGPRMEINEATLIGKLLKQWLTGGPLQIPGTGLQKLYPTHISDLVQGLIKTLFIQSATGKVFTLINLDSISVINFCYQLKKIKEVELEYVADFQTNRQLEEEKIQHSQHSLGWTAKVSLEEGLEKTLSWLSTNVSSAQKPEPAYQPKIEEPPVRLEKPTSEPIVTKPLEPLAQIESQTDTTPTAPEVQLPLTVTHRLEQKKVVTPPTKVKTKTKPMPVKRLRRLLIPILVIVFVLLLPFIVNGGQLLYTYFQLKGLVREEKNLSSEVFRSKGKQTLRSISLTQTSWRFFSPYYRLLGLTESSNSVYQLLSLSQDGTDLLLKMNELSGLLVSFKSLVLQQSDGNIDDQYQKINLLLQEIFLKTGLVQTEIEKVNQSSLVDQLKVRSIVDPYYQNLPGWRDQLFKAQQLYQTLPSLLGFDQKKTYLVLFQNNMELRPTGGFIGSYALVTFDKGRLMDWQIFDIYDADGQLRGHVEPPATLKKYLGEANWYFRDSNWDPDFGLSAKRAEWFLDKEIGRQVDGVIGVNLQTALNILKATGPVTVADYNETVSDSNLFDRAEYHAEVNFFPGSTQKKDFLAALSTALVEKIKILEQDKWPSLANQLLFSLDQKALLFSLHDPEAATIFNRYGWTGQLLAEPKLFINSQDSLDSSDYLMVVDSNVGVNKANYFLKQEQQWKATLNKDGQWRKKLVVVYTNDSPSESWPGGRYKDYCRIITSKNNKLVKLSFGLGLDSLETVDLTALEKEDSPDKQIYGYYFKVPTGEKRYLVADFEDEKTWAFTGQNWRYGLRWQKQPGSPNSELQIEINYPLFLQPAKIYPEGKSSPQLTVFKTDLSQDRSFFIQWVK
jgi:nucleoside-diphosphate-sugar epimerase